MDLFLASLSTLFLLVARWAWDKYREGKVGISPIIFLVVLSGLTFIGLGIYKISGGV